ncbi:hypothetical protein PSN45_001589 [Yamadazyma tenuis]|uniref:uncharacterized protein n=1 Tax=Candida tenuis TaxID=2315449 RepID=UPI0027A4260C|nr:hypothetical protein PSN45_001589 [Yamadazyma tenuis]
MFIEEAVSREDNLVLRSLCLPIDYSNTKYLAKRFETSFDDLLSKDSRSFKYLYSRNGLIQEGPFHKEFPKKATSLDNDQLYVDTNSDFFVRWFPRDIAKIIFPAIYFNELVQQLRNERSKTLTVEFMGGSVPTSFERQLCEERNGNGVWSRRGVWFCTCQNVDLQRRDDFGPKFFNTYNEWLLWDRHLSSVEEKARLEGDTETLGRTAKCKSFP